MAAALNHVREKIKEFTTRADGTILIERRDPEHHSYFVYDPGTTTRTSPASVCDPDRPDEPVTSGLHIYDEGAGQIFV
jgi:hypothetical protein